MLLSSSTKLSGSVDRQADSYPSSVPACVRLLRRQDDPTDDLTFVKLGQCGSIVVERSRLVEYRFYEALSVQTHQFIPGDTADARGPQVVRFDATHIGVGQQQA